MTIKELALAAGLSIIETKTVFFMMRFDGILRENRDYFIDTVYDTNDELGRNEIYFSDDGIAAFFLNKDNYPLDTYPVRQSFREVSSLINISEKEFLEMVYDGVFERGLDYSMVQTKPNGKNNDGRRVRYLKASGLRILHSLKGRRRHAYA